MEERWVSPDDLDELAHVDVVRHQELGLVQEGKLLLSLVPLDDHLQDPNHQSTTALCSAPPPQSS